MPTLRTRPCSFSGIAGTVMQRRAWSFHKPHAPQPMGCLRLARLTPHLRQQRERELSLAVLPRLHPSRPPPEMQPQPCPC